MTHWLRALTAFSPGEPGFDSQVITICNSNSRGYNNHLLAYSVTRHRSDTEIDMQTKHPLHK